MDKAVAKKIAPVLDVLNKVAVNHGEAFKNNLRTATGLIQAVVTTLMTQGIYSEMSASIIRRQGLCLHPHPYQWRHPLL